MLSLNVRLSIPADLYVKLAGLGVFGGVSINRDAAGVRDLILAILQRAVAEAPQERPGSGTVVRGVEFDEMDGINRELHK